MDRQMTIWDLMKPTRTDTREEPAVGDWVETCGPVIDHIMIPGYIGRKVLFDTSTESMTLYKCGILEDYIPFDGHMRAIIYTGKHQRSLITLYPGRDIYETLPWNGEERMRMNRRIQR